MVNYQEGTVVNKFLVNNEHMKFVIKAFDAGTELPEHAAPGDVVVFALEGEGVIVYEGEEFPIKAGENFHFVKGGLHYVKGYNTVQDGSCCITGIKETGLDQLS